MTQVCVQIERKIYFTNATFLQMNSCEINCNWRAYYRFLFVKNKRLLLRMIRCVKLFNLALLVNSLRYFIIINCALLLLWLRYKLLGQIRGDIKHSISLLIFILDFFFRLKQEFKRF